MAHAEFVHLHLHTEYSLLDGACRLDRLMEKARELGFGAMAITDHGNLHGAIDFYQEACKKGIKPIIGCEVYVAPGSRLEKKSTSGGRDVYHHLVLLARDETGYKNLIKLSTAAHLEGFYYKPRIDKEILTRHREGLIALSGCLASEIPELIQKQQLDRARAAIDWFKQTFGAENFYLELQNHGLAEQRNVNRYLIPWAGEFGLKLVATNDVHYVRKEDSHAHDSLICIGTQSLLSDTKRMRYEPEQYFLRSVEEMRARFSENPEAVQNTLDVAEKCNLEIEFNRLHFPTFSPPEHYTREGYLRKFLAEGLSTRYGIRARVEGDRFIVEHLEDPRRLPTFISEPGAQQSRDREGAPPASSPPANVPGQLPTGPPSRVSERSSSPSDQTPALDCSKFEIALTDPAEAEAASRLMSRLQVELQTIEKTGFISYFLIVGDFIRYARSRGISCVARGSAAGSLVTYLLEISNIDPIRYGLLFERFLNPERVNPPDIDIDFADDRRGDVIEYVREKYGRDSVAQIITFGTMGAKMVVRDVGRVMGLSYNDCDRLAKMIPADLKMNLALALKQSPELKTAYETEPATRRLIDTAFVLEDLTRNASVHAAGVVIGDQPLVNLLPLKQDEDGTIVTQYAMGPVGDLGLLKMDFLGLKTLTIIRNTCELVKELKGIDVPIDHLPLDDAPTYQLLNKANTLGVFQLESGGMRDLCRKFQISSLEHITALIALYRPGPMELIPEFIRRRHGGVRIEYEHSLLEPICRETYGIMVYQEQVMQAAQVLAGFSLGKADLLRRAMGKKQPEEMQKHRDAFVKGCAHTHRIPPAKANQIFDLLEKFAGYGFNKSHAAAYAMVAYQTAYLKANHPVEFLCAMMTNDMANTDKLSLYIKEARSQAIEVLPPDVNESQIVFAPAREGKVIRFGLAAVKGVGEVAVQSILKARGDGGRFSSLPDFCQRVEGRTVNRKVLEALIKCGAFDALGETRASLYAQIDMALARAASLAHDRQCGQASLFGGLQENPPAVNEPWQKLPEWSQSEMLAAEKELLGFYVSGHPLTPYVPILEKYSLASALSISQLPPRSTTRIGGMVTAVQQGISKKSNKPYALVTLEDLEASVQLLSMNENFEKYKELLVVGNAVMVVGEINNTEDKPKIFPQEVIPLEEAPRRFTKQVHFRLHTAHLLPNQLESVKELARSHAGQCPLYLCLMRPSGEIVFIATHETFAVKPSRQLQEAADDLFGEQTYYAKIDSSVPERQLRRWERGNGE